MANYRTGKSDPRGSLWHRWEPHIHPPGTLFNDEYPAGDEGWEQYLSLFEAANPQVSAVAVTDYYGVDVYDEFLRRAEGRLPSVDLVFPNVELRLNTGTGKAAINLHLLVAPDDPNHVAQIKHFLKGLTIEAQGATFHCDADDLRRLGRQYKPNHTNPQALMAEGANQFKVDFGQLRKAWRQDAWVQDNVLVAVAGSSRDGTAGLGGDPAFDTLRAEIESFAHIIFSANPAQRAFWLGHGKASRARLDERYNGRKACLHGSDAHGLDKVLNPDLDRRCWIKGDPTFEGLRQAVLEPEDRVYLGAAPTEEGLPSQIIAEVDVSNANWLPNPKLPLSQGLICVIGARGSGKTALADLVAAGAYSVPGQVNERSFLRRAKPALGDEAVTLAWADGEQTSSTLGDAELADVLDWPRAQYLSQQFVDQLCAADGVTTALMTEIHRVIFQAHDVDDRLGATNFDELLEMRCARATNSHDQQVELLASLSEEILQERERSASLQGLKTRREGHITNAGKIKVDRAALIPKGDAERAGALETMTRAVEAKQQQLEQAERQRQAILGLSQEVATFRTVTADVQLRQLRARHAEAGLSEEGWKGFRLDYAGDVDQTLQAAKTEVETRVAAWRGRTPAGDGPFVTEGADLSLAPLAVLQAEQTRLQKLVGIDRDKVRRYAHLSQMIAADEAAAGKLERDIAVAEGADGRINSLIATRNDAYRQVMSALADEQQQLEALYAPLKARLEEEVGALAKLTFNVRRAVDVEAWALQGEDLLDVRTAGAFRGRGALANLATSALKPVWETGTPDEIVAGLASFLETHRKDFIEQANVNREDRPAYRRWGAALTRWLYSADHVKIAYSVQYDQTDIEQLSPGTRGIVLLLLYLAVDREDLRPLIIDQPEENLDPKSIFDELVPRFRAVKKRRQVMIVTHNANLVVNADADQVIVASCGPHRPGALPEITYQSGSLEDPDIRKSVCDTLEGGEEAFKERARRLRVRLPADAEG